MTDETRRHQPTARRLERLRQAGAAPHSAALVGVLVLAAATALLVLSAPTLCRVLGAAMAESLRGSATEAGLMPLLGRRLLLGSVLVITIASAVALTAAASHAWQARPTLRPPRPRVKSSLLSVDPTEALLGVLALGGGLAMVAVMLRAMGEAATWAELTDPRLLTAPWLRQLCLLAGLATLHLLWTRARHQRRAMMTDRELRDEQRETQGAWLRQRRKQRRK